MNLSFVENCLTTVLVFVGTVSFVSTVKVELDKAVVSTWLELFFAAAKSTFRYGTEPRLLAEPFFSGALSPNTASFDSSSEDFIVLGLSKTPFNAFGKLTIVRSKNGVENVGVYILFCFN